MVPAEWKRRNDRPPHGSRNQVSRGLSVITKKHTPRPWCATRSCWSVKRRLACKTARVAAPVVAETWAGYLNESKDLMPACRYISGQSTPNAGPVLRAVGGGTGMVCYGFKRRRTRNCLPCSFWGCRRIHVGVWSNPPPPPLPPPPHVNCGQTSSKFTIAGGTVGKLIPAAPRQGNAGTGSEGQMSGSHHRGGHREPRGPGS